MTSRRLLQILALVLVVLIAGSGAADAKRKKKRPKRKKPVAAAVVQTVQPPTVRTWVSSSISRVLATGAFPGVTAGTIDPDGTLDGPALGAFVAVAFPQGARRVRQLPAGPVTMGDVDRAFVSAAGLDATAARAERLIADAGYVARPGVGYEIVARLLRLRTNLGQSDDAKEHAWYEQASRADAIWSTAQALDWGGWEKQSAIDTVELLATVPQTPPGPRHDAIQRAFDFIGMPYIWGGTSEKPQILFGFNTAGGFDCSGFVWRVTALDPTSPTSAAAALGGRTTYEMAADTPAGRRLRAARIQPGDVLLFGSGGVNAQASAIGHTGLAISSQLFIQSSGQGVALARWDTGYYQDRLAFGKSVLP